MTANPSQTIIPTGDEVRLPLSRIGLVAISSCVLIAIVGGLISGRFADGLWTLPATIPGVLLPLGILLAMPAKQAGAWGLPVIGGTMVRALVVLGVGIAIYQLIGPAKVVFFMTLLAVLLVTLIVDVASVLFLIQQHPGGSMSLADAEVVS